MYQSKVLILSVICFFINVLQSENLPSKEYSILKNWLQENIIREKISSGVCKVMSFNTMALPVELYGHEHKKRFALMGDSLLRYDSDIIVLQETFHPKLRKKLLSTLTRKYYTYSDYYCSNDIVPFIKKDCFGGLMTFSSFPIVKENFIQYPLNKHTSFIEKIGAKGFIHTVIHYGDKFFNIINTHLYAGDSEFAEARRLEQIRFMQAYIIKTKEFILYPTILAGDFNVHHPDVQKSEVYNYITNDMGFADSKEKITTEDYTSDRSTNKYVTDSERRTKLDYVFYKDPDRSHFFSVIYQCKTLASDEPLSDHFAWNVILQTKTNKL
jgi:endonuclease/exonuclease/phosphatase family metal-dependent hydrolase